MTYTTLITPEQLQRLRQEGRPLMVFDCSSDLATPASGPVQFEEVHIAGAVYANVDTDLSVCEAVGKGGRHAVGYTTITITVTRSNYDYVFTQLVLADSAVVNELVRYSRHSRCSRVNLVEEQKD